MSIPFSGFGVRKAVNVINADLINNVGNLVTRACAEKVRELLRFTFS